MKKHDWQFWVGVADELARAAIFGVIVLGLWWLLKAGGLF